MPRYSVAMQAQEHHRQGIQLRLVEHRVEIRSAEEGDGGDVVHCIREPDGNGNHR